jgi:hypothetical protein
VLARVMDPEPWNLYVLVVGLPVGLVVGGLLGSRAPQVPRAARIVFGAVVGAGVFAAVGGTAFLFLGGPGHGLARFEGKNFVIGAIVGEFVGLVLGGLIGARTVRSERSPTV